MQFACKYTEKAVPLHPRTKTDTPQQIPYATPQITKPPPFRSAYDLLRRPFRLPRQRLVASSLSGILSPLAQTKFIHIAQVNQNMKQTHLQSIQEISVQYGTGDLPVLVLCSDLRQYICKYMRPNATIAYKLVCELLGSVFAGAWKIATPACALVQIHPAHWGTITTPHSATAPAIGFCKIEGVIDITQTSFRQVAVGRDTLYQLLKIALFDFWIANEDRTCNNANLLYRMEDNQLISIDYGGILNNVSFDYPLSQLTETDSILGADLFAHIVQGISASHLSAAVQQLEPDYQVCIHRAQSVARQMASMPDQWNVPSNKVSEKIAELFAPTWVAATWENFITCLTLYSNYGK